MSDYHDRFLQARAEGRFVVPRCESCGRTFWHPRSHCPFCLSTAIGYVEPGSAEVYTYTVNHRPKKASDEAEAAMLGYVEFPDGLRLLVNLDLPADDGVIGARVRPETRRGPEGEPEFVFVADDSGLA
jgi:uncharacterized OB-fold protein